MTFSTACAPETIIHDIGEREANTILELLADHDIQANKLMKSDGRTTKFDVLVNSDKAMSSIRLLNQYELPRRADKGYADVFGEGGLIPTSSEEKAKELAALEGEIQKQLKLVDGILDTEVNLVIPENNPLRNNEEQQPTPTASLTIRYLPGKGGSKPITEQQVQVLVSAAVENLSADKVFPLMTPVTIGYKTEGLRDDRDSVKGSWIGRLDKKTVNILTILITVLFVVLASLLVVSQLRLNNVRGRLLRLQNEIANARKRQSGDSLPPAS